VNVYVVVAAVLIDGDQVPVILLFDVVGKVNVPPLHIAATCVNVGVIDGFTVTVVPADAKDAQPPVVVVTVYVPEVETVIVCVVAPFDQVFPVAEDEVKTTDPPAQKVVGPPAEIVGAVGIGFTVTTIFALHPSLFVNVIVEIPWFIPVTTPLETLAILGLLDSQALEDAGVPLPVNCKLLPTQTTF